MHRRSACSVGFLAAVFSLLVGVPRAFAATSGDIGLIVFGDDLPREELRAALARDLGRGVTLLPGPVATLPCVTVTWRRGQSELAVTYDEPGKGTVARVVPARSTPAQTVEDATVLATSLVRNEADELLGKPAPPPQSTERAAVLPPAPAIKADDTVHTDEVPACASFFYPAATNWNHPYAKTRFAFNVIYGLIGELDNGFQLGTVNVVTGSSSKLATGNMTGAQFGFGINYAQGQASGLQLALLGNATGGSVEGGQVSLGANISGSRLDGFQIASINVAGDLRGTQIGVVNIGGKVTGSMIGVINVAEKVNGFPFGIVSITRSGGVHPIVWGSTASSAAGGFKFATDYVYTIITAQYAHVDKAVQGAETDTPFPIAAREFVGGGFYIGGHAPIGPAYADFDLGFTALTATETDWAEVPPGQRSYHQLLLEPRVRVLGGYPFAAHLSVFAGASLAVRARLVNAGDDVIFSTVPELVAGVQF